MSSAFYAKVTYITFFEGVTFLATLHISMFLIKYSYPYMKRL